MSGATTVAPGAYRAGLMPRLAIGDPSAAWWLGHATLRLRREICWLWRERESAAPSTGPARSPGGWPPFVDRLGEALDLARFADEKRAFFEDDVTAGWLTAQIRQPSEPEPDPGACPPGGFGRAVEELGLEPVERLILALGLLPVVDSAVAPVFAACANDARVTHATLAVAQRLWDAPEDVARAAGSASPLARAGLLAPAPAGWDDPILAPRPVALQLLFPTERPAELVELEAGPEAPEPPRLDHLRARLATARGGGLVQPVRGAPGAPFEAAAARLARELGSVAVRPATGAVMPADLLRTLAWVRGAVAYLPFEALATDSPAGPVALPLPALPGLLVVGVRDAADAARLPREVTLPTHVLPPLGYRERLERWRVRLDGTGGDPAVARAVADSARRFRLEAPAIDRLAAVLAGLDRPVRPEDVEAVCRADVDLGGLAQRVEPRFALDELMLPSRQEGQIRELIRAAAALTVVHHQWGTARPWRESGLSALFAGPPGTGKTMAAEVIAAEVGMPLVRIDLSQVVNKYIGETEKNLRRVFDAADASDDILFFDEADALFGKRTEVKDAHDRYANLEVSYLLERMERFRGLAILATNRKKDLDDAFLRRLRFVVEFPLPSEAERRRIWESAIPDPVDGSALDLAFLAERFALSGGHIRSVVFQACLQSAADGGPPRLDMPAVVKAVRNELEKAGRTVSFEQFGPWASHVRT